MPIKIFLIDFRRTWFTCISLILLCFISGAVFLTALDLTEYLSSLFQDVNLGVDMVILPKTITPESMQKSLLNGQPEALLPLALFQTLQKQASHENAERASNSAPIGLLGFIPFRNDDGVASVATIGDRGLITNLEKTSWSVYPFKELSEIQNRLIPKEIYETEEWKDKTIFGILVNATEDTLSRIKQMVDRRTIAQAYILKPGHSDNQLKLDKLKSGLMFLGAIIVFSILLGVIVSFQKLNKQRFLIFRSLNELGRPKFIQTQILTLQIVLLVFLPLLLGMLGAYLVFPFLQTLI